LIGLSSGFYGAVCHHLKNENDDKALQNAGLLKDIFGKGSFFLEIQDHDLPEERKFKKNWWNFPKKLKFR
jgi:DNA polymerase-3 subunit alpha